jgi:hypothetical protein
MKEKMIPQQLLAMLTARQSNFKAIVEGNPISKDYGDPPEYYIYYYSNDPVNTAELLLHDLEDLDLTTLACDAVFGQKLPHHLPTLESTWGTHYTSGMCSFSEAKLSEFSFQRSKLRRLSFVAAIIKNATFANAELDNVNFADANSQKTDFSNVRGYSLVSFKQADLTHASFENACFDRLDLSGANTRNTNFKGTFVTSLIFHSKFLAASMNILTSRLPGKAKDRVITARTEQMTKKIIELALTENNIKHKLFDKEKSNLFSLIFKFLITNKSSIDVLTVEKREDIQRRIAALIKENIIFPCHQSAYPLKHRLYSFFQKILPRFISPFPPCNYDLLNKENLEQAIDAQELACLFREEYDLGIQAKNNFHLQLAAKHFNAVPEQSLNYAMAQYELGNLLKGDGQVDDAITCFTEAANGGIYGARKLITSAKYYVVEEQTATGYRTFILWSKRT